MVRALLGVAILVALVGGCGKDAFSGKWQGKVAGGSVELTLKGGEFNMHTTDLNGKPRNISGTAKVENSRRIVLMPLRIDGARPAKADQVPLSLTLSTDGKQLQSVRMILTKQ